ncbi:MAG: hypothetical protein LBT40_13195 [Deltaproteobacteria bacterium]|nr:hypothetical protein [Deltaproteobacteria bacterium]
MDEGDRSARGGAGDLRAADVRSGAGDRSATDARNATGDRSATDARNATGDLRAADLRSGGGDRSAVDVKADEGDRSTADARNGTGDRSAVDGRADEGDRSAVDGRSDAGERAGMGGSADGGDRSAGGERRAARPDGPGPGAEESVSAARDGTARGEHVGLIPAGASPGDDVRSAHAGAEVEIFIGGKDGFGGAGILYRTGSSAEEKAWLGGSTVKGIMNVADAAPRKLPPLPKRIEAALKSRGPARQHRGKGPATKIWYWLEDAKDVKAIAQLSPARVILPLNAYNSKEIGKRRVKGLVRVVWSVPPLVYPPEGPRLTALAAQLMGKGYGEFMCATLSGAALVMEAAGDWEPRIYADHRMGFLNRFSAEALHSVGIDAACVSAEVDSETWERLLDVPFKGGTLCYLSGRPALFTSRMVPAVKRGQVESPRGEKFWSARDGEAFVLLPEARVFMGGFLKGPELPNLMGYIVDLRREKEPAKAAMAMRKAAAEGRRTAGSGFNFRRGLF